MLPGRPTCLAVLCGAVLLSTACAEPAPPPSQFPRSILLTNDNGIDDPALVELALALDREPGIEVTVVAATRDRSGTSNFLGATNTRRFEVERRDIGPGVEAWALDGYPADCVVFALSGPLRDRLPDLVVSGINGGPNMADDWFGSGTIGAARTAAYFGIPAIAVSGVENDDPAAVAAAVDWVVRFVRSSAVSSLEAPQYLTISLPSDSPPGAGQVRIVDRARGLMGGRSARVHGDDSVSVWELAIDVYPERAAENTDVPTVAAGHVAIVPMRVNEFDEELARRLRTHIGGLPRWAAANANDQTAATACAVRLGIRFDDAEDESGREWGVLVEEMDPGSLAHDAGLAVGDVIVTLNGKSLETDRLDPDDPDDLFASGLRSLSCGSEVVLEFVRDGRRESARFTWEPAGGA